MQIQFNEQELLYIINRQSKLLNLFQDQNSKQTQVIILVGLTGAGKSTLFNFLSGAEFQIIVQDTQQVLSIKDGQQQFAIQKGGMKSVTKCPNYYFSEMYKALIIDFPGFQDTDGKIDQVLTQLLFYQIVRSANVKIVYVVKHPETQFNNRGTQLQDFIRQTFQGQNFEISQICLMLNGYNDKLTEENLILNVQNQLERIYNCRPQNICVMRKIKNTSDIEQYFTPQKRNYLFQSFLLSYPVIIFPQQIHQSEQISQYLSFKSQQIFEELCYILEKGLNGKIETFDQENVIKLEKQFKVITQLLKAKQKDMFEWFQELINQLLRLVEILQSENQINQCCQNFLAMFNFFSKFSELISGYEEIRYNGIIAEEKCESIVKVFQSNVNLIVKQRELLQVQEQKKIEAQERQRAEQHSQLQAQLAQQAQQSYQQQQILHQNTQNTYNQGIKEIHEYKLQQQELIYQSKLQQANNQKLSEENNKIIKEFEQTNQNYDKQINTFNAQSESMKKEIEKLNSQFQEIKKSNLTDQEKQEKFFNELNEKTKQLKFLETELELSKEELKKLLQDSNNNVTKLAQEVQRIARRKNKRCQIF